jgi:hypothetical protein
MKLSLLGMHFFDELSESFGRLLVLDPTKMKVMPDLLIEFVALVTHSRFRGQQDDASNQHNQHYKTDRRRSGE